MTTRWEKRAVWLRAKGAKGLPFPAFLWGLRGGVHRSGQAVLRFLLNVRIKLQLPVRLKKCDTFLGLFTTFGAIFSLNFFYFMSRKGLVNHTVTCPKSILLISKRLKLHLQNCVKYINYSTVTDKIGKLSFSFYFVNGSLLLFLVFNLQRFKILFCNDCALNILVISIFYTTVWPEILELLTSTIFCSSLTPHHLILHSPNG